ncbi:carboxylating nicotinate-nucleotide diphosphorylase [halophilic archaeon]|nr:carboxylating nicotinate-nucleotide diphosphorylase [halophilic archaeon]
MIPTSQIEQWLEEDLGHHDVTSQIAGETTGRLVAKETGVVAGLDAAVGVFEYLDAATERQVETGDYIDVGDTVLTVEGPACDVLRGERVAVNITGHASGIATKTRQAVAAAQDIDDAVRIAGTRKTTPGLRGIDKRAVVAGGGDTHRLDLSHMVMVKDNHIAEMGFETAITHFQERASFTTKIEVEVEQPADAPRAAAAGADIVLLDNLAPTETEEAVEQLRAADSAALAEASGNITLSDVPSYAATGVNIISMGCLTHSAGVLDYSFQTT